MPSDGPPLDLFLGTWFPNNGDKTTQILSALYPERDCGPNWSTPPTTMFLSHVVSSQGKMFPSLRRDKLQSLLPKDYLYVCTLGHTRTGNCLSRLPLALSSSCSNVLVPHATLYDALIQQLPTGDRELTFFFFLTLRRIGKNKI